MRTDMTRELAGSQLRCVVTIGALEDMLGDRPWDDFMRSLFLGDPRTVRAVLRATAKAAGDLRPLEAVREVDRVMEVAGFAECAQFAADLIQHAIDKAEAERKNFPAVAPQPEAMAAFSE